MKGDHITNIDCPSCGEPAMRVTEDKNGHPFGHCTSCAQQLRVGPNPSRVARFKERYGIAEGPAPKRVEGGTPKPKQAADAERPEKPVASTKPAHAGGFWGIGNE